VNRRGVIVVIAIVAGALVAAGGAVWMKTRASAGGVTVDEIGDQVQTVARGSLPVFAKGSTGTLYAFAAGGDDVLQWMPCTCGCADLGHGSNRACYIKAETEAQVTYTSHAAT
jgi:uncharacterized protein with PCYCGC motif